MRFTHINEQPIADLTLDELYAFFHEHAFFKFMDSGRAGLVMAADDMIDNFVTWIQHKGSFGRGKLLKEIPHDGYLKLRARSQIELVNGLITQGSEGIRFAVNQIYLMTLDAIIEARA